MVLYSPSPAATAAGRPSTLAQMSPASCLWARAPGVFRPEHIVDRCHHVAVCALIEARIPCGIGAAWGDDDNLGPSRGEVAAAIGGARLDEQGPALR